MDKVKTRFDMMAEDQKAFQVSEARNFLIFKSGTQFLEKVVGVNTASIVVAHNLGYVPANLVYVTLDETDFVSLYGKGNYIRVPYNDLFALDLFITATATVDTNNITFSISMYSASGGSSLPNTKAYFKYYIFREKAN